MSARRNDSVRALEDFVAPGHRDALIGSLVTEPPGPLRAFAGMVLLMLVAAGALLWTVPWLQTAAGSGRVVALNPADRVQQISALVDGRINRWYVDEGSVVRAGDPIVEIRDIDPRLVERLQAERAAVARRLDAARSAAETAAFDYRRQKALLEEGLSARKEVEAAKIKHQEALAREAAARAELSKVDIGLSRQSSQVVTAPEDGRIISIVAGNTATVVRAGDPIAAFAPEHIERAVEVFVSGLDAPLVQPGLAVRVMFEGWPAVQFSGWPEAAVGTFGGRVAYVDPAADANGRFRVIVADDADDPWPDDRYLRIGSQARAWIRLGTVRLGYELWRQLNRFPPRPPPAVDKATLVQP